MRVDLRAWAPGDWGGSWTGPAWEVNPSQPVIESPIDLTGWAELPQGLEDPRVANPANGPFLPQPQVDTTEGGDERLSLSLRRRILARSVVETSAETWSPTTGTWVPVPIQSTTTTADPDPEFEQVTLLLNLPPSPHLIARLRLTL